MSEEKELTMADMEEQINASMVNYHIGDMVHGIVAGIENYVVYVDIGSYMQGIILPAELSDDPSFSMIDDIKIGDEIDGVVTMEDDGNGNLVLSRKQAVQINAWDELKEGKENETVYSVKVSKAVKGGVIAYLNGIRGFIPVSRLAMLANPPKNANDDPRNAGTLNFAHKWKNSVPRPAQNNVTCTEST